MMRPQQALCRVCIGALLGLVVVSLMLAFNPKKPLVYEVPVPGPTPPPAPHLGVDKNLSVKIREARVRGHFDVSGKYKILPYVFAAERWSQLAQWPVCAGVQTSLDRAAWLPRFVSSWPSALSLALFAPGPEFPLALSYVRYLRHCYPAIREQVTIHVVFPADRPPVDEGSEPDWGLMRGCHDDAQVLDMLLRMRSNVTVAWRSEIEYPQNILRNVAREHCQSDWVTCPDIDMLFPRPIPGVIEPSIAERLNSFLTSDKAQKCKKCAFVLPIYEIEDTDFNIPCNKTDLLRFIKEKKARQYHIEVFKPNQGLSNLNLWEKSPSTDDVKDIYAVKKYKFWYEPIYITKRGSPRFDERYLGFGMVRNTQVYEMHLAGYTFHVLDNVFLSHWGFQRVKNVTSKTRKAQTSRNYRIFIDYHLRELAARYDTDPLHMLSWLRKKNKKKFNVMISETTVPSKKKETAKKAKPKVEKLA